MDPGMSGKVGKAHRYARERDRLQFSQIAVSIAGDNGSHQVRFDNGQWECNCDFFAHRHACAHTMTLELVLEVGGLVLTAVVLVVGMKFALNGLREDVREIKVDVKALLASDADQDVEIAELKTRQESHTSWVERLEKWLERLQEITERRGEARE